MNSLFTAHEISAHRNQIPVHSLVAGNCPPGHTPKEEPMKRSAFVFALLIAVVAAEGANAAPPSRAPVAFVQTNEPDGNHVASYDVTGDGTLTQAGAFTT